MTGSFQLIAGVPIMLTFLMVMTGHPIRRTILRFRTQPCRLGRNAMAEIVRFQQQGRDTWTIAQLAAALKLPPKSAHMIALMTWLLGEGLITAGTWRQGTYYAAPNQLKRILERQDRLANQALARGYMYAAPPAPS